jgi:GTPase SAR1 family protein
VERGPEIEELRTRLVGVVTDRLTPVAQRYGYSEVALEATIKWRPLVLILGNYSSGKSTLINELLGGEVQATGQAPTDDSFTVITCADGDPGGPVRVTEEREGQALLADPQYPFPGLKRHGQRFAAHFRLKKVNSPFLRHLALVDTPGMLDSTAERDRGYDYQSVIGDLAEIADLVLVLFDPHKAGTVREAHASLRETLPAKTFEDRVLFVLNRVDECDNLSDLLRVYGTLCWNLSQMLGRKDIPPIRLTFAPVRPGVNGDGPSARPVPPYLTYLENQREDLRRHIEQAPRFRLDHLAAYAELHGERLSHFLEGLVAYKRARRRHAFRQGAIGFLGALAIGAVVAFALYAHGVFADVATTAAAGGAAAFVAFLFWLLAVTPVLASAFHRSAIRLVDELTPLGSQSRKDSWNAVRPLVRRHLEASRGRFAAGPVRKDLADLRRAVDKQVQEARLALDALAVRGRS